MNTIKVTNLKKQTKETKQKIDWLTNTIANKEMSDPVFYAWLTHEKNRMSFLIAYEKKDYFAIIQAAENMAMSAVKAVGDAIEFADIPMTQDQLDSHKSTMKSLESLLEMTKDNIEILSKKQGGASKEDVLNALEAIASAEIEVSEDAYSLSKEIVSAKADEILSVQAYRVGLVTVH